MYSTLICAGIRLFFSIETLFWQHVHTYNRPTAILEWKTLINSSNYFKPFWSDNLFYLLLCELHVHLTFLHIVLALSNLETSFGFWCLYCSNLAQNVFSSILLWYNLFCFDSRWYIILFALKGSILSFFLHTHLLSRYDLARFAIGLFLPPISLKLGHLSPLCHKAY